MASEALCRISRVSVLVRTGMSVSRLDCTIDTVVLCQGCVELRERSSTSGLMGMDHGAHTATMAACPASSIW